MNKKGNCTKEEARRLFVEAEEDYTFETLSEATEYAASTLKRWSSNDPKGRWIDQRDNFRTQLSLKTQEKTIEKTSERLSEEYAVIQERHYRSYRVFSELAVLYAQIKRKIIQSAMKAGEATAIAEMNKINPTEVNFWNLVMDRSLKGEAASIGLPFHVNPNSAIQEVERQGWIPVALPDGMTKEDLQEMIDEFETNS